MELKKRTLLSLTLAVVGASLPGAQTSRPSFEVASIKQNLSDRVPSPFKDYVRPGGRFVAVNQTLMTFIQFAYRVQDAQVIGGPAWVRESRFDVTANAGREVPAEDERLMVQALLADRFQLVLKPEQRDMAFHEIVLNRADGRLGTNLRQLAPEDDCPTAGSRLATSPGFQKPAPGGIGLRGQSCGLVPGVFADFAYYTVKTPVVDRTGLTGSWVFLIHFGADPTLFPGADNPNMPNFFTAWQEQLGLRLRPTRGPVDVLTIQSVKSPSQN